ncbi:MAG: site-2 protease family protein [Micrococcales bacterium]|nr:site-2 protease family protein [Micrococcales bacterium]
MTMPSAADRSAHGWRIGRLAGTPVYLGRSWPIVAVVIVALFAPPLARAAGMVYGILVALAYAVLLLVSVLVHEAAHASAARWSGHPVDRIVADVWGGHTVYDATRSTPGTTALVAVVGPLANLALAGLGYLLQGSIAPGTTLSLLTVVVTFANLLVGLFNLLPGLPLDGGQILSSAVWALTGSKGRGLAVAGWSGRAVAALGVAWALGWPLLHGSRPDLTTLIWAGLIGVFLWRGASAAIQSGHIYEVTSGPIDPVLDSAALISAEATIAQAIDVVRATGAAVIVATDVSGWPVGVIDRQAAASVSPEVVAAARVSAVVLAQPPAWVIALGEGAVLTDVVRVMGERELSLAVLVDEESRRLRGVVRAERVNEVVGAALARRGHT